MKKTLGKLAVKKDLSNTLKEAVENFVEIIKNEDKA